MRSVGRIQMRTVNVSRGDLLVSIKENRTKHLSDFAKSEAGYKVKAISLVKEKLKEIIEYEDKLLNDVYIRLEPIMFNLRKPESHIKDYDQAIAMLEMSVDKEIEVEAELFACYVMDEWDWKVEFDQMTTMYVGE